MYDYDSVCPDCGTLDSNHDPECSRFRPRVLTRVPVWVTRCASVPGSLPADGPTTAQSGHWHCQHGHTEDCPDPAECGLINWCPDLCPACGLNLRREGFPIGHQHADTGKICAFRWLTG